MDISCSYNLLPQSVPEICSSKRLWYWVQTGSFLLREIPHSKIDQERVTRYLGRALLHMRSASDCSESINTENHVESMA